MRANRTVIISTVALLLVGSGSDIDTRVEAQSARQNALETYANEQGSRPEVEIRGTQAMVVSSAPLASLAGARILQAGGNAIDAAVAVGAALNVTTPDNSQLGGDTIMLIYWAETEEIVAIDGYSRVPSNPNLRSMLEALPGVEGSPEAYREEPRGRPRPRADGVLVAMVPGTAAAWTRAVERFGTKSLAEVFAPAIEYAEQGFPITASLARELANNAPVMTQYPSSAKVFFPNGRSLEAGEVLVQKNLATTFKQLAEGGFDVFYKGAIAEAIADYVQQHGGVITKADLASYDVVWREPYRSTYRGYEVVAAPPPTAAIHVLQQLNIIENYDLAKMGYHSADALHVMIEATKLAGADRRGVGGDPDFVEMPIRGLLSKKYAAERQALIDMDRAMTPKYEAGNAHAYESEDTTHFVVLDQWGNMVSCTTTLGSGFGSQEVVEGTGILLQNRTWWMALDTGPNVVEPNRRANIGHSPILIFKDGKPFMAVGSPGGDTIRQTVFQGIVNVIDFDLNMQEAVEAARFAADPLANRVRIESRTSAVVLAKLERRGHQLERAAPWRGSGNLVGFTIDAQTGVILGGYDPRRNSMAIGW